MTLTLTVDAAAWRTHVESVANAYAPLVPVVKGNGYGFGRQRLVEIAAVLLGDRPSDAPPTIAVGTVHELAELPDGFGQLVLTPVSPGEAPLLRGHGALATVASVADVAALDGWRCPVVVKLQSSMRRLGARPADVAAVIDSADAAGLGVIGAAIHLPLAGSDQDRLAEVERWLPVVEPHLGRARQLWVSHLSPESHAALRASHPDWTFPMRVGTRLWHGDKSAFHLAADVIAVHDIGAGETAGYHGTPAPGDGSLVVVGAGSAHGVVPLDDGRSPFHYDRRRLTLLERPHMHSSMLFVPAGDVVPSVSAPIDVQRPLISVSVDAVIWA